MTQVTTDFEAPRFAKQLIAAAVAWRWPLLILGFLLAAVSWPLAQQMTFNRSLENMFSPGDPLLPPLAKLKRTFGNHDIVLAAYVDPQLMTSEGLQRVERLAEQLGKVPTVVSVLSLNRSPLGTAVLGDSPQSRAFLELFEGFLIGADRQTTAVVCLLERDSGDQAVTIDRLREITEAHAVGGVVVGEPVMVVDGFRYLEQDGHRLQYVSTALVVLTVLICFRSVRWVVIPLAVVQLALWMTLATLVLAQLQLTMVSAMLAANVTIIGIATTVHLVVRGIL